MKRPDSRRALSDDFDTLVDAEILLGRYPEVSQAERDRIGHFLRHGSPLDIGLLSSNAQAWKAAETFKLENPRYFASGFGVYAGWAVAIFGIGATLVLIKDMGLN